MKPHRRYTPFWWRHEWEEVKPRGMCGYERVQPEIERCRGCGRVRGGLPEEVTERV